VEQLVTALGDACSIGGNVATNAGGLCCVKYGVTTDYILGLDVVFADGTLITLGGKRIKDVAGLSFVKLFVGASLLRAGPRFQRLRRAAPYF
jgi:FAD/FMN-containing dehydrogenase